MLASTLRIAWRNLGRNRRRTALALGAIAIAELVLVFYQGLFAGYMDQLVRTVTGPLVGHVQVHAPKWRDDHAPDRVLSPASQRLEAIRATPGVKSATARLWAPTLVARGPDGEAAMVIGVDVDAERAAGMLVGLEGDLAPRRGEVLLGTGLARALAARPGDELALVGQATDGSIASGAYRVRGVADTQVDVVNRAGIVMGMEDARELLAVGDAAHELVVVGEDPQLAAALKGRLAALPVLAADEVLAWRELAPEFASIVDLMWAFELFVMLLVFVAAAAGAANTMVMSTFERTHELGMLLALGARPRRVVGMVLAEGLMLGALGLVVGGSLGTALVLWAGQSGLDVSKLAPGGGGAEVSYLGMKWSMTMFPRFDGPGLLRSGAAVLVTVTLAALWPAVRAARQQPVEALRA